MIFQLEISYPRLLAVSARINIAVRLLTIARSSAALNSDVIIDADSPVWYFLVSRLALRETHLQCHTSSFLVWSQIYHHLPELWYSLFSMLLFTSQIFLTLQARYHSILRSCECSDLATHRQPVRGSSWSPRKNLSSATINTDTIWHQLVLLQTVFFQNFRPFQFL